MKQKIKDWSELNISNKNNHLTPGFKKIIEYMNYKLEKNTPIDIAKIVDDTNLSWTYVKKNLEYIKKKNYSGFNFEKLGNSWIVWKTRDKIIAKLNNTCGKLIKD
ncbi:MAG: hypothetical protein JXA99_06140 [Candidatus Lokiarchaeota archaeon]|nr:hypothetical protein [Candidatus Lokiarchaeota archaeon]